jgi:DNA-binding response OmpR family regulator
MARLRTILYIDCDNDGAEMVEFALSEAEHNVTRVSSIGEARQLIKTTAFDLYLLERQLPDGSGVDLCRELRQLFPTVPIVFYSCDVFDHHKDEAIQAGATEFIAKPEFVQLVLLVTYWAA